MDPFVILLTVVALLVASRVAAELLKALRSMETPAQPRLDLESLGADAGVWPGLYRKPTRQRG